MKQNFKNITCIALIMAAPFFSFSSYGQVGTGPNPYRDCGIGAALFPNTNWAAVTSNVTWDVGTTAVISATASPETCQGSAMQTAQFLLDTYDNVIEETAKGSGEHLAAMLNIFGCEQNVQPAVITNLRTSIAPSVSLEAYAEQSQLEKASHYFDVLIMTSAGACSV